MTEQPKWHKELLVFNRLVNTLVFTGNVNDQYPVFNEEEDTIQRFYSLDGYLQRICQSMGYQAVISYDPVEGFRGESFAEGCDPVEEVEWLAEEARKEIGDNHALHLIRHGCAGGKFSLIPDSFPDAAHLIFLVLTRCRFSVAVILKYSSRMMSRPDDLDVDERMTFLYLQDGAAQARWNSVCACSDSGSRRIQNQLLLVADKLNDLPAWYFLNHPALKNIDIPRPDYRMRGEIIEKIANRFPGYSEADPGTRQSFIDTFVGASEGFSTQDIVRVYQIVRTRHLDIRQIGSAILLYKHGVQDNPWQKLDGKKLAEAESIIKKRVLGQDVVVRSAVDIVKRAAMGMSGLQHSGASSKPRGILFLAGPTGTGKTELAKALTELIFLDERNMIRFDMSEYRQEQSDQRLLGAPPGYVGYEEGGQLTNAIRAHPFSVLLFDEIEKAHPTVLDKFLQILEDGRITDGRGETVYFQDCLIIFTSNLGITIPSPDNPAVRIQNVRYEQDTEYAAVRDKILYGVRHYFNEELGRPELLNRIGNNVLVFDFIREDSLNPILSKQIDSIAKNLMTEKNIRLQVSAEARQDLHDFAKAGLPEGQGGRGIGNLVEELLINPLARYLFDHVIIENAEIVVEHIFKENNLPEISVRLIK